MTRNALILGTAGLLVAGMVGCSQKSEGPDLKIVEQVQIDENGNPVAATEAVGAVDPAGGGQAKCEPVAIAMAGALTGPDAALGINIRNGVKLAVDKHNKANPGCQVTLKEFDTEGDPQKASGVAPRIIQDQQIIGLIGPAFSGETEATGGTFNENGLVAATASATRVSLGEQGWKTFIRGLGNDAVQGKSVANYLKNTLKYQKICVVDDSSAYGSGLADVVRATLKEAAAPACKISVKKGDKDFSAAVNQVKGASPDAVFYAGYYAEASLLVQQLRDAGVAVPFVSGDGTKDPEFVKQAGESSKDALLSCPCGPSPKAFADEYSKAFGQAPGTYSNEGYDLATIMLRGIDSGKVTRSDLLQYVHGYDGQGVARHYKWTDNGELVSTNIWIYKVQP
jgi:branched-chain amino acid transport system substrate-binding protein